MYKRQPLPLAAVAIPSFALALHIGAVSTIGPSTFLIFWFAATVVGPVSYTHLDVYKRQVHAYGTLELVEDEAGKDALVIGLIRAHEPGFEAGWRRMPDQFRQSMLAGIVGFRIPIDRIEGKFKISQNREEVERENVRAAHAAGSEDQQALAGWMARLNG